MTTKYVIGAIGRLVVADEPPRCEREGDQRGNAGERVIERWYWPRLVSAAGTFLAKRGVLLEVTSPFGERLRQIARVLPEDAHEQLALYDEQVKRMEEALVSMRAERQEFLEAAAMRGERVRVKS